MYENDDYLYTMAEKRVKAKKKFRSHVFSVIGISLFLSAINLFTSPAYFWAIFPILGMGLSVFFHGIKVYGGINSDSWEEKELQKEMERMRRRTQPDQRSLPPLKEDDQLDELELKELKKQKAWNEDDLV